MLEKAAELFCSLGFGKTSVNDIADSLALKRSSVYHYFPSKEAILRELFIGEFERRVAELEALFEREGLSPTERLILAIEGAISQRLRGGSRFLVFDRLEAEVPEDLRKNYNRARRRILDLYARLVRDGIDAGEFRGVDPQLTAFAIIGMSNWTALWYSPRGRMQPHEVARKLTSLLVHGISQSGASILTPDALAPVLTGLKEQVAMLERLSKGEIGQ